MHALLISAFCQSSREAEIRKMEQLQVQGILEQDSSIIQKITAADLIVNAPSNSVIDAKMANKAFRQGYIHYSSYQQQIDTIKIVEDIGIVMGLETMKPIGLTRNAGKTVKRRFTDVWMYKNNQWQMIARQATNISIE
jgi:hypothetical protein